MNESASQLAVETIGTNPTPIWGMTVAERVRRIARATGMGEDGTGTSGGGRLLASARTVWDPAWLRHMASLPGTVLTLNGTPALAHARDAGEADALRAAMETGGAAPSGMTVLAYEDGPTIENKALRKRETPFLMALEPGSVRAIERASYFGAYKGVTDILTKYLWPEWALVLTRIDRKSVV